MGKVGLLQDVMRAWCFGYEEMEDVKTSNGSLFRNNGVLYDFGYHFPLAIRKGCYQLINADKYSSTTSTHQNMVIFMCSNPVEIPFSALSMAMTGDFNYSYNHGFAKEIENRVKILDKLDDYVVATERTNNKGEKKTYIIHSLGASLIMIDDKYYLSGIDETGKNRESSYFLTEIIGKPECVADAYELLKPEEVKFAENECKNIYRQGEWFFIEDESHGRIIDRGAGNVILKRNDGEVFSISKNYFLDDNSDNPIHHFVSMGYKDGDKIYVRGIVKHSEGDHKQVKLYDDVKNKKWYRAVHNISGESFSAAGKVD